MCRWQETGSPEPSIKRLPTLVLRHHGDARRQVRIACAQSVGEPGADRWSSGDLGSSLDKGDRGIVIDGAGMERTNDTEFVCDGCSVRQQFAELGATFAM